MLDQRAVSIKTELDEARALREEAQTILASYERKQKEVSEQAARIVEDAKNEAKEAAEHAKEANVKNLKLTNFSGRYSDESVLIDEAKQTHNSVIAAKDLLEIDI